MSYTFRIKLKLPADRKENDFHEKKISKDFGAWLNEYSSWRNYIHDMKKYSIQFPDVLFMFECDDEHEVIWRNYFKNGKSTEITPQIIWKEFDESQLQ